MSTISTFRAIINSKLIDNKKVLGNYSTTPTIYDIYIQEAVKEYSQKKPYVKVYAHTTTSTDKTVFDVPTDYEDGFSEIINIEYPLNTTEPKSKFPPCYIDPKYYEVMKDNNGLHIRFIDGEYPASGQEFWVRYTLRHTVDGSSSTVQVSDEEAICNLALSLACESIANYYATTTDSTISADVINYQSKALEYNNRADKFRKIYNDKIKDNCTGLVGEWDSKLYWNVTPMFHDRDYN